MVASSLLTDSDTASRSAVADRRNTHCASARAFGTDSRGIPMSRATAATAPLGFSMMAPSRLDPILTRLTAERAAFDDFRGTA